MQVAKSMKPKVMVYNMYNITYSRKIEIVPRMLQVTTPKHNDKLEKIGLNK